MKASDLLLGVVVLGLAGFVGVQAIRTPRATAAVVPAPARDSAASAAPTTPAAAPAPAAIARSSADGSHTRIDMVRGRAAERTPEELADVRRRIGLGRPGTWIDDAIRGRDSVIVHWRPRDVEPLRVWIAPARGVPNRRPEYDRLVREAFDAWADAGAPIRVTYVPDSASAEVPVLWVERFTDSDYIGVARLRGVDGEVTGGSITLATHTQGGVALDEDRIRKVALHEVGHLLGLPHAESDTASVMLPAGRPRGLSAQDRATMRLLYTLPVGSLRSAGK